MTKAIHDDSKTKGVVVYVVGRQQQKIDDNENLYFIV